MTRTIPFTLCVVLLILTPARAADTVIDFEDFAVGTLITTDYSSLGVTFSALPDSCGLLNPIDPVIVDPSGTTSSGTRGLSVETGCPDFSPDYLRIVFAEGHARVSFTLGDFAGTYHVRGYNTSSGAAGLVWSSIITIEGTGSVGVHRLVTLTRPTAELRRVEIEETIDQFEVIDDLTFDCPDATFPTAEITTPAPLACVCNSSDVLGSAYDADHDIASWRLERKAPSANAWTLISLSSAEVIDGLLATWTTAAVQGYYNLRLRVENECDLQSEAITVVWLDKAFDNLALRSPADGAIVGGTVCADGSAWDMCPGTLTVGHRPLGAGVYVPFGSVSPPWVLNDPLGSWNTLIGTPDGDYEVRLNGTDNCGNSATIVHAITVDNTPPIAKLSLPKSCDCVSGLVTVRGTADDNHLRGWTLQYSDPDTGSWVTIASGHNPVSGGILGTWDTTHLPDCAYVLRLVVTDDSIIDCDDYRQSEYLLPVEVGPCYDFDADDDNDVDLVDYAAFESEFTGP